MDKMEERVKAVMLGHAVGDALGVPVEFFDREALDRIPVDRMLGFGTHRVPRGCWSDDTSMSLAALDSLISGEIDYDDIMRKFGAWYYDSEYTPTGVVFDVGGTCSEAIDNYFTYHTPPTECGLKRENSNGNGSLMRIHPFALFLQYNERFRESWEQVISDASRLTHAHERSVLACKIFSLILFYLIDSPSKASVRLALREAAVRYKDSAEYGHYLRLFSEDFEKLPRLDIESSGYVVDTLEAAVFCVLTSDSYRDCVLKAVNLGGDTDTVGAVAGALAGALWGFREIPAEWLSQLWRLDYVEGICELACKNWQKK